MNTHYIRFGSTFRVAGFTLAELLVAVSIIAIITSSTVVAYANILRRTRDTKRLADMEAIHTALDAFYADHGHYPGPQDGITRCGQYIGVGDRGEQGTCVNGDVPGPIVPAGGISIDTVLSPYMDDVPHDPLHPLTENNSADGYSTEYYYAYDPEHNVGCPTNTGNGIVFGFNRSESQNANLEKDSCNGPDMGINQFDFNRGLFPPSQD